MKKGIRRFATLTAAAATVQAIKALRERSADVATLQEIHRGVIERA